MRNFYQSFVPKLAFILRPLYAMLGKGKKFEWSNKFKNSFDNSKIALAGSGLLTNYDANLPIKVASDASPSSIGAILSHVIDSQEKPVKIASRSLRQSLIVRQSSAKTLRLFLH
ncbi:hypothetical protein HOLleu_23679 [Holothuria leucospilota]|uniref:Reverse transcriptase/retrotransposon-derived protein RNase H-like domain-containing protein n=1 Tax=Holothuria leucospilota TaxID=206669 RepID=A0A9Q1BUH4_HOLLE|nr:hypothetical protein HOLleu_23679 [Holothuria leucospilota]